MKRAMGIALAALGTACTLDAQSNTPILSGAMQFVGTSNAGVTFFQPLLAPVLIVPIGEHWLVESRAELQGFISRQNGTSGSYQGQFFATLDYAQLDYIANAHLTVTLGRFLTPFNVYNERFGAVWIRNLQDDPIIFPIGTRTTASSNGGMLRGVAIGRENWELNYTAYFSASSTVENLQAGRAAGGRTGVFFPKSGFEFGVSYQRFLQAGDYNASGAYLIWQPLEIPFNLRAEYAHSLNGQGYWLEGTYRLAKERESDTLLSRLQAVARVQQFYKGTFSPSSFLPSVDTNRFDVGLNYYLPHEIRLNASYGRKFSSAGNANIWNAQITYRFLFPAWPGAPK